MDRLTKPRLTKKERGFLFESTKNGGILCQSIYNTMIKRCSYVTVQYNGFYER